MQAIRKTNEGTFRLSATRQELELLRDTVRTYLMDRDIRAEIPCEEPEWREEKAIFADLARILEQTLSKADDSTDADMDCQRSKTDTKQAIAQERSLMLAEILNLAASGYPDEFLKEYYEPETGQFNKEGSGDTLAEFIVLEIRETFDPNCPRPEQLEEVARVLRNGIRDLEAVIAVVENA